MKVLGVSGSPVKNSNTDRALKIALAATGVKTEFIKLSEYNIQPCNACLECRTTNNCVLKDDGNLLMNKAYKADALIIARFTPYSSIDSRTKIFMERLYPLHHRHALMSGKPGAAIVTCVMQQGHEGMTSACENGISAIQNYMMAEAMNFIGGISVLGNVPCLICNEKEQCNVSALKMLFGKDATPENVKINSVEDDAEVVAALEKLGGDIVDAYYH